MCGRSSTFRKRVSFYGATPPAFVFGKDRFARAANACLFRSGPAQNVGGVAPGNKSQLPEGRRPSAHQAAEPRKHWLEKCRYQWVLTHGGRAIFFHVASATIEFSRRSRD